MAWPLRRRKLVSGSNTIRPLSARVRRTTLAVTRYRIIFNKKRSQLMVVSEAAMGNDKSMPQTTLKLNWAAKFKVTPDW